jgi:hypothetical protein
VLEVAGISYLITASLSGLVIFAVAFVVLNYALYGLFSIGLPTTDKPPELTPVQRRAALSEHSRALGRPLLWLLVIGSWLFALGGAMALLLGEWVTGLLALIFFGGCAALFTWQLRLAGKHRDVKRQAYEE